MEFCQIQFTKRIDDVFLFRFKIRNTELTSNAFHLRTKSEESVSDKYFSFHLNSVKISMHQLDM